VISADAFNVEQTSVGCKAYLAQFGKIFDAPADTTIASSVNGSLAGRCVRRGCLWRVTNNG
jgi:hypothetical protein